MLQPPELHLELPMVISNGILSTTKKVWGMLLACKENRMDAVSQFTDECPEICYAQYNYTPPIHFAVREGNVELVEFLLQRGAYAPAYKTYPFQEDLLTIAVDRGHTMIIQLLKDYVNKPDAQKYKGDNGQIIYNLTDKEQEFQSAVDKEDIDRTSLILKEHPEFALNELFFWGEGILMMPAKDRNHKLLELLLSYGAKVPHILKWAQAYYFKHYDTASFLMKNGMDPNIVSWQGVTLLHDMAQKGDIEKARLLIDHGAELNPIDDEYLSTPLGMAARWGHTKMVAFLIEKGADKHKAGADWSKPIEWAKKKMHGEIVELLNN